MKANYNEWFHKYNQYIETKNRGNVKGYNDTSWIDIMKRIKVLESAGNELYNQPLGVAGTERGFSHLLDLMAKSNYSFNDIDESLLKSYKHTLQASMSNMMMNSHAIVLHCTSEDKKYVSYDQMTRYYVVDVPFIQMHFGERDEFIRQKLQMMHTKSNGKFIDIQQFVSEEFDKILNFSLVVTVNGYFCNDCKIAIDEHGFKFKIAWTNSASDTGNEFLDIIIYKLDVLRTHHVQISTHYIKKNQHILISDLGIDGSQYKNNHVKCLIDFYSPEYLRGGRCNPIFGLMTDTHLLVHSYDGIADQFINTYPDSARCFVIIYELENIFEIPNIFPATNYFDVLDDRRVYTERAEGVVDYNDFRVVSEAIVSSTKPPICTPPIIIDRDSTASFNTIIDCINLKSKLYKLESELTRVGGNMSFDIYPPATIQANYNDWITIPLTQVTQELEKYYATYLKGAILTSRVPKEYTSRFREVIDEINSLAMDGVATNIPSHTAKCDVYNRYNWYSFVDYISEPFERESMRVFLDIKTISQGKMNFYKDPANASFYDGISPHRFNRPISEQCFITLKWNLNRRIWLFAAPKINHFKGIGNSFYIDSGLTGNEIFKFFVQYTDTDNPVELETDPLTLEQVYDFDKFYEETSRHLGYIKYWNAENKLMKLSKILYGKYDDETVVQVLGRILSGSVSADEIINQYGSEIKYDDAGKSSLAYNKDLGFSQYDPFTSDAAPFTINYLFYTMMMIHDNVDNIEALFMRMLVDKKYSNRYIDVNISDAIDTSITVPVNYSGFSKSPILVETASSNIPIGVGIYYGIPFVVNNRASSTPQAYRYTFNKYDNNIHYPLLLEDGFAPNGGYLCWDRIEDFDSRRVVYSYDIQVGKLVSKYLTYAYTCISNIETNYAKTYDCRYLIDAFMSSYNLIRDELFDIRAQQRSTLQTDSLNVIELIVDNNEFLNRLDHIKEFLTDINKISYNNKLNSIRAMLDDLVKMIKKIYVQTGFDNESLRRIRNLYAYLCKYNNIMNIHELKSWWEHLDIEQIQHLVNVLAENPNFNESETTINSFYTVLNQYMHDKFSEIEDLDNIFYENTLDELNPTHFSPLSSYLKTVFTNYIFDLYAIDQIEFDKNPIYQSRPYYVLISVNADNFKAPMDIMSGNYKLLCKADTIANGNGWSIDDIVPLCEYACFDDTPLSTLSAEIFDRSNNSLGTIEVDMTFMKAGSSVGSDGWLQMLPNIATTSIAFNNDHEDMTVVSDNVVSSIHSEMNFEMLYGNKYIQLDHDNAYVLDPVTYEEHVQEIVRVPNKMLNSLLIRENSNKANPRMFFKAGQVIHLPINETTNKLISVYGKCFVGQTLYLATDDGLSVFPVKVTAIDHTIARGFIEAEVDSINAKWFETTDPDVIDKYLSTTVECHILDDNMMNFVKEYNNSDYGSYYIPSNVDNNGDTPESLPGDPIFVTNNEKYVYSRLNYFFHEDIPNRFIDDEKAAWKFIYLGEAIGKYGTVPPEPSPTPVYKRYIPEKYRTLDYINSYNGDSTLLFKEPWTKTMKIDIYFETADDARDLTDPHFLYLFGGEDGTHAFGMIVSQTINHTSETRVNNRWGISYSQKEILDGGSVTGHGFIGQKTALRMDLTTGLCTYYSDSYNSPRIRPDYAEHMDRCPMLNNYDVLQTVDVDFDYIFSYASSTFMIGIRSDVYETITLPTVPMALNGWNNNDVSTDLTTKLKIYRIAIWDTDEHGNDVLIHNLVPVEDTTNYYAGLFDIIDQEFYGPATYAQRFYRGTYTEHEYIPPQSVADYWAEHGWVNPTDEESSDEPSEDPTPQIDTIKISLINKETTDITLPERYPILREEPDDHQVWDKEEKVFNKVIQNTLEPAKLQTIVTIAQLEYQRDMATDDNTRNHYQREIESMQRKLQRIEERIEKINHYNEQKECPTTWYNVRSLEAALIYINNGRAITDPAIIIDKRDIPITDRLNVFLYDWKNKKWIDPATYTVRTNVVDMVIDNKADYITPDVMKEMIITSDGSWLYTDDILVYVAFNKSDIYDEITLNDNACQVKFKPIISTAKQSILNPYGEICIRKHFDGHESYKFTEYNAEEHEFDGNGYYIKRVSQNGKYVGAPVMRICDMTLTSNGTTLNPEDLTVYIKMPFGSISNVVNYASPQYVAQVYSAIDDFTPDETIRLICVNNNSQAQFNGAISTVMFEAVTSTDENERQIITITKSTLNSFIEGDYICTVFRCNDYKSYGGLVLVNVSSNTEQIMTDNGRWVRIPIELSYYKELPDEFVVVPNDTEMIDPSDVVINLDNVYKNSVQDEITVYNENDNPFEFYFNEDTHVRYPISNVTMNDPHSRFVVDVANNPDVQVAKMTYIGISRYASLIIPEDGVIDVTGSIPTPLSRDRYEWWVNGRQIKGDDVVILSPTSFQLRNLRSLKNFELIELVDDIHDSEIMTQGNVYVDINGKTYGSYRLALLSNKAFVDQSIRYLFNTSNHTKFNDYTRSIDNHPNNNDIEDNILDQLTYDDSNITKYTQLYNKPSINGITIYNMSSTDLGLSEIPVDKLINMYDEVWKKEIITDPLFVTTHKEITATENHIVLHSKPATGLGYPDSIVVYASGISEKCFTLYVSKSHNGRITDLVNTVKIIPLIRVGTYAIIEKEYSGMWLHCTESDVETIKI